MSGMTFTMSGMASSAMSGMSTTMGDMTGTMMMSSAAATMTASAAAASSTDLSMGMGDDGSCKVSMLWNWYTIDACFLSSTWHITSSSVFAGSCIGVILLVMTLEFLRRLSREYDRYIVRSHRAQHQASLAQGPSAFLDSKAGINYENNSSDSATHPAFGTDKHAEMVSDHESDAPPASHRGLQILLGRGQNDFRPSLPQQLVRATLHMLQFAVAYFVMLLAMYYNGYIIICIFIGAWLGAFVFSWGGLGGTSDPTGLGQETTGCCG